jgi:hypothetical protein
MNDSALVGLAMLAEGAMPCLLSGRKSWIEHVTYCRFHCLTEAPERARRRRDGATLARCRVGRGQR